MRSRSLSLSDTHGLSVTAYNHAVWRRPTVMEKCLRLGPLVWPKLPRLASSHHTHDAVPRVSSELCQRLGAVHYKVSRNEQASEFTP